MAEAKETIKASAPEVAERKRAESIWWGGALLWAGVMIGAERLNVLPDVGLHNESWPWIVLGLGVWALIWNGFRLLSTLPNPNTWDWAWTVVFLLVGFGGMSNFTEELLGAVILMAVGAVVLLRGVLRRT
jgi:hypothetical protein